MDPEPTKLFSDRDTGETARRDGPWLVLGLGNPGEEYADTLHNVGFRVLDILAARWNLTGWQRLGPARVIHRKAGTPGGDAVVLVKPSTYMNRTGRALPELFARYGNDARLLVVSDDLALPVGRLRIREKGSAGGHNGLKSINSAYGSDQYLRVRVGIQTDGYRDRWDDTRDYVLSPVPQRDRKILGETEQLAADAVEAVLSEGVVPAMSRYNGMKVPEDQCP
jgi:PTH1 family peptidyl-tRNA hydrolase